MQIGEFARLSGVSVRTIRYYEELGLISPEQRSHGGFRLYGPESHRRLAVIHFLKEMGLSLTQVREVLSARKTSSGNKETVMFLERVFREKLDDLESRIDVLQAMKAELVNVLKILSHCSHCDRDALIDVLACGDCLSRMPRGSVPDTLKVILQ